MGWFQKWFNRSPGPDWDYLTDNQGRKFWFLWDDDNLHALTLHHRGKFSGYVNIIWEPPGCELADIVILDRKFRHCGLGKALLQEVISHVRAKGITSMIGMIMPGHHGEPFSYLQEWYSRQGFSVNGNKLFYDLRSIDP